MTQSQNTNFALLLIATVIGGLLACGMLAIGTVGFVDLREQETLDREGIIGTAQVIETEVSSFDCYRVKYELQLDGVGYQPTGFMNLDPDWTDCLETVERVQAQQFGTIQVVYLPDRPEVSQPAGPAYFNLGISRFLTMLFLGAGGLILLGLLLGWWFMLRGGKEAERNRPAETGQRPSASVYPLYSQYEALDQKVAILYAERVPANQHEQLESYLAQLQATHDDIDQWIIVDYFGKTQPYEQTVSARFLVEGKRQKPTVEAVAALVEDIASHPNYKAISLTIKSGIQSFKVAPDLHIPLAPLLPKAVPKEDYLILSNKTAEIAGFQVQSLIFPTDINQRVEVIRHPRYPSSGRYPSAKVLDLVQAEAKTSMHLQLVVPRKEGRGQKFEVHSSYQSVPTAGLSAAAMFAIGRTIHAAGLASDEIQLAGYPNDLILSVADDLKVTATLTPQPQLTRIEYS